MNVEINFSEAAIICYFFFALGFSLAILLDWQVSSIARSIDEVSDKILKLFKKGGGND